MGVFELSGDISEFADPRQIGVANLPWLPAIATMTEPRRAISTKGGSAVLRCSLFLLSLTILLSVACSNGGQPESETFTDVPRIVDLSYSFEETTLYWPNNMPFQHDEVA